MAGDAEPLARRRSYDQDPIPVDPAVRLYVEREASATRGELRSEFAEQLARVEVRIASAQAQSTKELAEVAKTLGEVLIAQTTTAVALEHLVGLPVRVGALERVDAHGEGRQEGASNLRRELYTMGGVLITAIGVATTLIIALAQ